MGIKETMWAPAVPAGKIPPPDGSASGCTRRTQRPQKPPRLQERGDFSFQPQVLPGKLHVLSC